MDEVPEVICVRRESYLAAHGIEIEGDLGFGLDGYVWRTSRRSALKIHRSPRKYRRERDVYLLLRLKSIHCLAGFSIPLLINYDDSQQALELSIVDRPFCLDFAESELDRPIPELDDPMWIEEKASVYGSDWNDVLRLLNALRQYGIFFRDVHIRNISLRHPPSGN